MNVRKPIDYSTMFKVLDVLMAADLPQMELCRGIGRVVGGRPEKGAAVAAAEYLQAAYPNATGFSPRNLRRMRDFYRTYESVPEVMAEAMAIAWTQNVVIMEAELTLPEKTWYIRAARQFGWSKSELAEQIADSAHLEMTLDFPEGVCYTEENSSSVYPPDEAQTGRAWHRPRREKDAAAHPLRLRRMWPPDWDRLGQPPYFRRRCRWQAALADRLYRPPRRCCRPLVYG